MGELWLTYTDGDGTRRRLAVGRDEVVIGRHSESDLVIADSRLSRRHAKIARSGGAFVIEDLGSSNGTDVNGSPVFDAAEIHAGDVISFGGLEAAVEIELPQAKPVQPTATPTSAPAAPAIPRWCWSCSIRRRFPTRSS